MPTPSEKKALAFIATVILLGGAVRVVRAGGLAPAGPTASEQQALARQAFAASSSSVSEKAAKSGQQSKLRKVRMARKVHDDGVNTVGGVASVPRSNTLGFPPPLPRIDSRSSSASLLPGDESGNGGRGRSGVKIDLDVAGDAEIETLPRVGPALAKRIVANRKSEGPFRSLDGLKRVKGIGPATLNLLGPLVTFSGQTRP